MRFLNPKAFWLLIVWAILPIAWTYIESKGQRLLNRFASSRMLGRLVQGYSRTRALNRFLLLFFSILFSIFALARPQMSTHEEVIKNQGLDLVFLLDVSNSMLTEDEIPSRLKKAKHIIRNFVDKLSGDRAGIVAFAGSAYPAVPLTTDYDFLKQTLEILDQTAIANQGTDFSKALQVSSDLLLRGGINEVDEETTDANAASQVIVVLSDGEWHESYDEKTIAALKDRGIRIYSIGIGSLKGAPIPMRDHSGYMRGYKKDANGKMVLSKLEQKSISNLASATGGKYFNASSNEGEVDEIISNLSTMNRAEGNGRHVMVYDELFQVPLGIAIFLLFLFFWTRPVQFHAKDKSPALTTTLTSFFVFLFFSQLSVAAPLPKSLEEYNETKKGTGDYQSEDYSAAIEAFGKAQALNPDSSTHHLNLGDALLKSGDAAGAAREFEAMLMDSDPNTAAKGAFNLGKALEAQQSMELALQAYQKGLDRLKDYENADPKIKEKIKKALQATQRQKQKSGKNEQQDQKNKEGSDKQDNQDNQQKDDKDDKKKQDQKQNKKYDIPRKKPKFKQEKLSEADAKRILQQLEAQEKDTKKRIMRMKSNDKKGKQKGAFSNGKDW